MDRNVGYIYHNFFTNDSGIAKILGYLLIVLAYTVLNFA